MKRWRVFLAGAGCLGMLTGPVQASLFDHASYDAILRHYVDEDGLVDYSGIRDNSLSALESYFVRIGDADLAGWPYKERLAFWINVYNARVLYLVAQKPNLKKISEDFEMFNRPFKVAGSVLSLNDIEHRILRGTKNPDNQGGPIPRLTLEKRDPRIHFALVCGAVDCPPLRPYAYTPDNVEETLYGNSKRFANSSKYLDVKRGKLQLTQTLKWYKKDFEALGGVGPFLSAQLSVEKRGDAQELQALLATDLAKAEYHYDWSVNDQKLRAPVVPLLSPAPMDIPADASSTAGSAHP